MSELRVYLAYECGPDGYPFAWHERIKHDVRELAGHRCERCLHPYRCGEHESGEWTPCDDLCRHNAPIRYRYPGAEWSEERHVASGWRMATRGAEVEAHWRILTVHHLNGDKRDCRWWNLVALCQRCHLTIQGRVVMEREFVTRHSDWFRPYAAGWYAVKYLGLELTREQTMARLDELLALEQRQDALFDPEPAPPAEASSTVTAE